MSAQRTIVAQERVAFRVGFRVDKGMTIYTHNVFIFVCVCLVAEGVHKVVEKKLCVSSVHVEIISHS